MSSASSPPPLRLDPGGLVAAIPALLRFRPTDSVVLVGFTTVPDAQLIRCVLRADLPAAANVAAVAERLSTATIGQEIDTVAIVIITESGSGQCVEGGLPRRDVQQALRRAFGDAHVDVLDMLWVPRTEPGLPWRSYTHPAQSGVLPDPHTSPIATEAVLAGRQLYANRDDLAAHLAPDPAPILASRATRLAALSPVNAEAAARHIQQLLDQISTAPTDEVVLDEDALVGALHALTHPTVRDACLDWVLTEPADPAQRLWTVLTRRAPHAHAAHPASLLAATVYLHGDGVLANIAVERALAADPEHSLAQILYRALQHSIPPEVFRQLLTDALQTEYPTHGTEAELRLDEADRREEGSTCAGG
jgi:hypothetical protein